MLQAHGERDVMDVHSVGVAATNLNAEIVHGLLDKLAVPDIIRYSQFDEFLTGIDTQINFARHSVQVASASKPGKSNDWNSLQMALVLGIDQLINVKDVDGVYDADPDKFPDAKLQENLSWDEYLDIIGNPTEHKPGANYPIDPIAARLARVDAS